MRHLAAAILLALGGKPVDEKGIKDVLQSVGVKIDEAQVKKLVSSCKGKDVMKLCQEGMKHAPVPAKETEKKEVEKKDDKKGKKEDKPKEEPKKVEPKQEEPKKVEPKKEEPKPEEEEGGFGDLFG